MIHYILYRLLKQLKHHDILGKPNRVEKRIEIIDPSKPKRADRATHKAGGDQFVNPPKNDPNGRYINSHGNRIKWGPGKSDEFLQWIFKMKKAQRNCFFAVVGPPGIGKTYTAIRCAQMIDPHFKIRDTPAPQPEVDDSQVVFSREHLLHLLSENSPLKRGSVIIIDEPQYSLNSRSWFANIQQDLVNALAAVRHRGFVIFLVVLHLSMIDVHIRNHVLSMQIEMKDRGVGVAKERFMPQWDDNVHTKNICTIQLRLPGSESCTAKSCLECSHKKRCLNVRAIYERRKTEYLYSQTSDAQVRNTDRKNAKKELKLKLNSDQIFAKLVEHKDELVWNKSGNLDAAFVSLFVKREFDVPLGQSKLGSMAREFTILHPELKPQ